MRCRRRIGAIDGAIDANLPIEELFCAARWAFSLCVARHATELWRADVAIMADIAVTTARIGFADEDAVFVGFGVDFALIDGGRLCDRGEVFGDVEDIGFASVFVAFFPSVSLGKKEP